MAGLFNYFSENNFSKRYAHKGYCKICRNSYTDVVFNFVVKVIDICSGALRRTQKQVEANYGDTVAKQEKEQTYYGYPYSPFERQAIYFQAQSQEMKLSPS